MPTHSRVTELEFICWRSTVFGTHGQRILAAIKAHIIVLLAVDNENEVSPNANLAPSAQSTKKGKHCSNPSCPLKSRYIAATCKKLWRKCMNNCSRCEGRTHVCSHEDCFKIVEDHKE